MSHVLRIALISSLLAGCFGGKPDDSKDPTGGDDSATTGVPVDRDGDGFTADSDCDDSDATVHDGADELCDEKDNDCDSEVDEGASDGVDYYADGDADGFGAGAAIAACSQPSGTSLNDDDCDDDDDAVHPDATEICNDVDDDCDGAVDDGAEGTTTWYADRDADGYGGGAPQSGCTAPPNTVEVGGDCDDTEPDVHPGAVEVCNEVDDDCDGSVDEDVEDPSAWYPDADRDGFGDADASPTLACEAPAGYLADNTDCDDAARTVNPDGIEVCNDVDDDCDGAVDDNATDAYTLYPDTDGDSYGDADGTPIRSCDPRSGYSTSATDCDDGVAAVNPGADEVCDGIDNDCNGTADGSDASDAITVWPDTDRDGYGAGRSVLTCTLGAGFAENGDDCDDGEAAVNPAADEYCDLVDNDCDGTVDEDDAVDATVRFADDDGDGFGDVADADLRCDGVDNALDCDDADATEPQVVDAASTATRPDGSLGAPWQEIQQGIDMADQCVIVASGLYTENVDFGGKDILVMSREGAGETWIDGSGGGPAVRFSTGETSGAELRGFTLMNGTGLYEESTSSYSCGSSSTCTDHYVTICGGGLYVDGAEPTLSDLLVLANSVTVPADYVSGNDYYYFYGFGGGMCVRNTTLSVSAVHLLENYADDGGGAYVESTADLTYENGDVFGNSAAYGAGFEVDGGALTLTNALLAWNVASTEGGGVYAVDATVGATNVTIGECEAPTAGGVYASGTTTWTTLNSIIYGADDGVGVLVDGTATYTQTYSDVYGNTDGNYSGVSVSGSGNISADPLFTSVSDDGDYTNDNWSLSTSSPARNTGHPAGAYYDVDGTRNDMGAYGGPGGR